MKTTYLIQRFTIIVILLFCSLLLYSKNKDKLKSDEEYYWEFIAHMKHNFQLMQSGTWKFAIEGNYTKEDSIYYDSFMGELDSLMENVNFVKATNNPDFIIRIKTMAIDKKYELEGGIGYKNGYTVSFTLETTFSDSINQAERSRILKYQIIKFIIYGRIFFHNNASIPEDVGNFMHNGNGIIWGKEGNKLNNNDKEIIKRLYLKNFHWNFFKSYPKHYIYCVKKSYPNTANFIFKGILYFLMALYFYLAYQKGAFKKDLKKWRSYNKLAIVISFGFIMMFFFQYIYIENYIIREPLNFSLGLLVLFGGVMLLLNFLYVLDLLINKFVKDVSGSIAVKFISGLVLIVFLAYIILSMSENISYTITSDWVMFFLILLLARSIISFQELKIKDAVKEKDLQLANLQRLQHQTELQVIHSRINPHFLYNALNSIACLSKINPEKSESMALALSKFCRYSINKKDEKMALIKNEIESIQTYLEIEKIRFSEQLEYSIDCQDILLDKEIPRFLIQPLVENAIKHGTSEIIEKGIVKIEILHENENIILKVSDNGKDFPEEPLLGYGLQSIYDKLEIMYKGKATINWTKKPKKAIIISLPNK